MSLSPISKPQELHHKPTNLHPQTLSTTNQTHGSHPSDGPSKAETAQVRQLKVRELGGSSPHSREYGEAAATLIPVCLSFPQPESPTAGFSARNLPHKLQSAQLKLTPLEPEQHISAALSLFPHQKAKRLARSHMY